MLEHYDFLIAMTALTSLTILLKCACAIKYQLLTKEAEQMSASKNKILRSMVTKYESCFKLSLPIKNTESFVKIHLEEFRFLGISLKTLENSDLFCAFFVFFAMLLNVMGGIYYQLPMNWIFIQVITLSIFLSFLVLSELLFQSRRKGELFTLHLVDYFDNTLYTKLENQYIYPDKHAAYLQDFFEEEKEKTPLEKPAATLEGHLAPDMQELLDSLLEESKVTEQLNEKKEELMHAASAEKYHLMKDVIEEYL